MHKSFHIVPDTAENGGIEKLIHTENIARLKAYKNRIGDESSNKKSELYNDPRIHPSKFTRCQKKAEECVEQNLKVSAAVMSEPIAIGEMYCVDEHIKEILKLYFDDESATTKYLKERYNMRPKCRYTFPILTSMDLGWTKCHERSFCGPKFGRKNQYEKSTLTDNHTPQLNLDGSFKQNIPCEAP